MRRSFPSENKNGRDLLVNRKYNAKRDLEVEACGVQDRIGWRAYCGKAMNFGIPRTGIY
jgi:hypothetical protein